MIGAVTAPPVVIPAPPEPTRRAPQRSPVLVIEWKPGDVRCEGGTPAARHLEAPIPGAVRSIEDVNALPAAITIVFTIDASGRPLTISRSTEFMNTFGLNVAADLEPALAASAFAPGTARSLCRITYSRSVAPLASAPLDLVARLSLNIGFDDFAKEVGERLMPQGSTCFTPPKPLTMVFPRLDGIDVPLARPATMAFSYDIDASGTPVNFKLIAGDRNPALIAAFQAAWLASRFEPKAKSGCLLGQIRPPEATLTPPPRPVPESFRKSDANCPERMGQILSLSDVPFPENFRHRNITGWALVGFDTTASGEIINRRLIAAQPAADFGIQAMTIIREATAVASPHGFRGCVAPFRFQLDDDSREGVSIQPRLH